MNLEEARQFFVERGWDRNERARIADMFSCLHASEPLRRELEDLDDVREFMQGEFAESTPPAGWQALDFASLRHPRRWNFIVRRIGAIAAVVLLSALGGYWAPSVIDRFSIDAESPFVLAHLQVQQGTELFHRVSDVFDRKAGWVLFNADDACVGLMSAAAPSSSNLQIMRLTIAGEGNQVLSDANLAIVGGEAAEISLPLANQCRVHYRITASDDQGKGGRVVAMITQLRSGEATDIGSLSVELGTRFDRPIELGSIRSPAGLMRFLLASESQAEERL